MLNQKIKRLNIEVKRRRAGEGRIRVESALGRAGRLGMRVIDCTRTRRARLGDVLHIAARAGARS
jgi:hypothetical protein